jgi:dTDP-4-dehydrorhamnose reductase
MGDRVLLIGGAGLVGRHVRKALGDREVTTTFHRDPVEGGVELDITDAAAVRALIEKVRPDTIVVAAADPYVEACERDPDGTWRVNVEAPAVIQLAAPAATLVVFSSEYVFDGTAGPYRETDRVAPLNAYGLQKVALEELTRFAPRHLVLRVSGVFGEESRRKNFVWQLVDKLRAGATFEVPSDQLITPTDAASLGTTVVALLDRGATGTFHAAGPEVMSRVDFAKLIARAFGLPEDKIIPRPTAELKLRAKRPVSAGLSDSKLRTVLGHGLRPADEGLRELAAIR